MHEAHTQTGDPANTGKLIAAWLLVGIPLVWGVFKTAVNAAALFK
jgi:hypothetical protein